MIYDCLDIYKQKKILITGGTGFIGSSLVKILANVSSHVVLLLRKNRQFDEEWISESKITLIRGDISIRDTWERALDGVEYVFHLASHQSRYGVKPEPVIDLQVNVLPILHLLEICKESKLRVKILFSGSENEVGVSPRIPVNENFIDNPVTIFGINKLIAEKYLNYYAQEFGTNTVTLRLSNVYGPTPRYGSALQVVLNKMIYDALQGKIEIYGDGVFYRDFVFIEDVIHALLIAGEKINKISGSFYLIGSGRKILFVECVKLIAKRVLLKTSEEPKLAKLSPLVAFSEFDKRNFVADTSNFCSLTDWGPQISLEKGIDLTIDYFLNNGNV